MEAGDACALFGVLGDPVAMRYFDICRPLTRPEAADQVAAWISHHAQHGFMPGMILLKDNLKPIGHGGLAYYPETEDIGPELIYIFKRRYWGKGLATEFASAAVAFGFGELRMDRILATVRPENLASIAVLEKVGMVFRRDMPEMNRRLYSLERRS